MSKEFKIANWKVEVDWSGMTLAPVEAQARKTQRKQPGKPAQRGRKGVAAAANRQQTKTTEQGDYQIWV